MSRMRCHSARALVNISSPRATSAKSAYVRLLSFKLGEQNLFCIGCRSAAAGAVVRATAMAASDAVMTLPTLFGFCDMTVAEQHDEPEGTDNLQTMLNLLTDH